MGAADDITYNIPPLVLGDTFYEWMQINNNDIIAKLNEITAYAVQAGDGCSADTSDGGMVTIESSATIAKDTTFDGNVTFNGDVTTINSRELTIEDFNIVLGACGDGATDDYIGASGGGGMMLIRQDGDTASFLWRGMTAGVGGGYPLFGVGCSGAWTTSDYINLTGGVGLKSNDDTLRFKSGANATGSGFMLTGVCGAGNSGATYESTSMRMGHMSTGGVGITQGIHMDESGLVRIYDGVNKKLFTDASHGFTFGQAVVINAGGTCSLAHASSKADAEVFGIVSEVPNENQFVVTMQGEIHGDFATSLATQAGSGVCGGLTSGAVYFLSGTEGASGEITSTEVGEAGKVRKPLVLGLGKTAGYVLQYVGAKVSAETDAAAPTMRRINVGADGQIVNASTGITCDRMDTGVYEITHNFGSGEYSINATIEGTAGHAIIGEISSNYIQVSTVPLGGGSSADRAMQVLLAKDVT